MFLTSMRAVIVLLVLVFVGGTVWYYSCGRQQIPTAFEVNEVFIENRDYFIYDSPHRPAHDELFKAVKYPLTVSVDGAVAYIDIYEYPSAELPVTIAVMDNRLIINGRSRTIVEPFKLWRYENMVAVVTGSDVATVDRVIQDLEAGIMRKQRQKGFESIAVPAAILGLALYAIVINRRSR